MAKSEWKPRHGERLDSGRKRLPGRVERGAVRAVGKVPALLLHPVWGIMVAALIAFAGRGELELRSAGLLLIALWLCVDLWAWLLRKRYQWRFILGWSGTSLLLIGVMGMMWWWLDGKLQDQQDDVLAGLSVNIYPSVNQNGLDILVGLTNNGRTDLGRHHIVCLWNKVRFSDGSEFDNVAMEKPSPSDQLRAFGGSESMPCSSHFLKTREDTTMKCGDLTVFAAYSLETQPSSPRQKVFRFWTHEEYGQQRWYAEPVDSRGTFCG